MAKVKKTTESNADRDSGKEEPHSLLVGRTTNGGSHYRKQCGDFLES